MQGQMPGQAQAEPVFLQRVLQRAAMREIPPQAVPVATSPDYNGWTFAPNSPHMNSPQMGPMEPGTWKSFSSVLTHVMFEDASTFFLVQVPADLRNFNSGYDSYPDMAPWLDSSCIAAGQIAVESKLQAPGYEYGGVMEDEASVITQVTRSDLQEDTARRTVDNADAGACGPHSQRRAGVAEVVDEAAFTGLQIDSSYCSS